MMGGAKHWCFTINNYTDSDLIKLSEFDCEYIIYGKEVGENGTPHLQGYMCLLNRKTLGWLKKNFHPTCHLEQKRGKVSEALNYCKKDGDFVERGNIPQEQAARGAAATKEKYQTIIKHARAGNMFEIEENEPHVFLQYNRILKSLFICDKQTRLFTRGIWIHGPSGCGKTSGLMAVCELGFYEKPPRTKWWDGYQNEKVSTPQVYTRET